MALWRHAYVWGATRNANCLRRGAQVRGPRALVGLHSAAAGNVLEAQFAEGGFDERWRYCFDHELYVRLLLAGHKCEHLPVLLAAYRLHASSKTVAEGNLFDREFDQIADIYEPKLDGGGRRWCAATRLLRQSFAASREGQRLTAGKRLAAMRYASIPRVLRAETFGDAFGNCFAARRRQGNPDEFENPGASCVTPAVNPVSDYLRVLVPQTVSCVVSRQILTAELGTAN